MAVRTREEILEKIKGRFAETPTDSDIELVEDISDTFDDLMKNSSEDWKAKYDENDAEWRRRYTERFFDGVVKDDTPAEVMTTEVPVEEAITINDLFKED